MPFVLTGKNDKKPYCIHRKNKDEFCHPNEKWIDDEEFINDCLVFTLFDNVVKSADGVNYWIPYTEAEVNARSCFKSHFMSDWLAEKRRVEDAAPYQGELALGLPEVPSCESGDDGLCEATPQKQTPCLRASSKSPCLSAAGNNVLNAGRALWRYYHAQPDANPNASYYDIRLHFQGVKRTASGKEQMNATSADETYNTLLAALRTAHKALAAQIAPKVYEYGFLKK